MTSRDSSAVLVQYVMNCFSSYADLWLPGLNKDNCCHELLFQVTFITITKYNQKIFHLNSKLPVIIHFLSPNWDQIRSIYPASLVDNLSPLVINRRPKNFSNWASNKPFQSNTGFTASKIGVFYNLVWNKLNQSQFHWPNNFSNLHYFLIAKLKKEQQGPNSLLQDQRLLDNKPKCSSKL